MMLYWKKYTSVEAVCVFIFNVVCCVGLCLLMRIVGKVKLEMQHSSFGLFY